MPELSKEVSLERVWEIVMINAEVLPREIFPAISRATGRPIDASFGSIDLVDLKGFSYVTFLCISRSPLSLFARRFSQFWSIRGLIQNALRMCDDCYPETCVFLA